MITDGPESNRQQGHTSGNPQGSSTGTEVALWRGHLVVRKHYRHHDEAEVGQPADPTFTERLRVESRWLLKARDAAVVPMLHVDPVELTMITGYQGAATLATALRHPTRAGAVLAAVCERLADLHRRGLAHGNLDLNHVVFGSSGPRFCSPRPTGASAQGDIDSLLGAISCAVSLWNDEATTNPAIARAVESWCELVAALESTPLLRASRLASVFAEQPAAQGSRGGPRARKLPLTAPVRAGGPSRVR